MIAVKDFSRNYDRQVKYASFMNCVSYASRMTPFFDTVKEVETWVEKEIGDIDNCYIRPAANWQQVIDRRNSENTDFVVPIGQ